MPQQLLESVPMVTLHGVTRRAQRVHRDPSRRELIAAVLRRREALLTKTGALATWSPAAETGRIPKDTYVVRSALSEDIIDWDSPHVHAMEPATFERFVRDAQGALEGCEELFSLQCSAGADPACALPLQITTDSPLAALFSDTMFRNASTLLSMEPFHLLLLPRHKIPVEEYDGQLRSERGKTVDMCIAMDLQRRIGIVYGTAYLGAIKKLVFTVMNALLPAQGILPLHCAASAAPDGSVALFLGLSGTGKTTLSAIPGRSLIGDDEHLWSERGIANMEGGCYAKLIRLDPEKEPDIHGAVFARRPADENGVIIENALTFPDGSLALEDDRLTENSRASFPLRFLSGADPRGRAGHPKTIILLTADATGVLPPVAFLTPEQAERWFSLGYTSKLAGTETGVHSPQPSFSRFFGGPFMMGKPAEYRRLFRENIAKHRCHVYLVNTGWTGGPYGAGRRMDISVSRAVVAAALEGALEKIPLRTDPHFHFTVPRQCHGIASALLDPHSLWSDPAAYDAAAQHLVRSMETARG
jgi:phosphoenolpyruvate carboxykinase (ATP)